MSADGAYYFRKTDKIYAVNLSEPDNATLNLTEAKGIFKVLWYIPLKGGELLQGKIQEVQGGGICDLGNPPEG